MRVHSFSCGVNRSIPVDKLQKCVIKDVVSPISDTVPSQDLTITISNTDLSYSTDNPDSILNYYTEGQSLQIMQGYDVSDDGVIENLDPMQLYISSATANDTTATIKATDRFACLTGTYYGGQYVAGGQTLSTLAEAVFADMGLTSAEYAYDSALSSITVYNPIPPCSYGEALQLIANTGMCTLCLEANGVIAIRQKSDTVTTSSADYTLARDTDLLKDASGTRLDKLHSMTVVKTVYSEGTSLTELAKEESITVDSNSDAYVYLDKACHGYTVAVNTSGVTASITSSSAYMVKIHFSCAAGATVSFTVSGYEYSTLTSNYTVIHNTDAGTDKTWTNPLISTQAQAIALEAWLAAYYTREIDYTISYRGDPRIEAGDLFNLELKDRDDAVIRCTENTLTWNGTWSASMKARRLL